MLRSVRRSVLRSPVVMEQHVEEDIEGLRGGGGLEDSSEPGGGEGGGLNLDQDLGHGEAVAQLRCRGCLGYKRGHHDQVLI